jgi:hypothetical protein
MRSGCAMRSQEKMRLSLLDHALQLANHTWCSVPPAWLSLEQQRALAEAAAHVQSVPNMWAPSPQYTWQTR